MTTAPVRLRVDSATAVVVEMSEGYSMNPGNEFTLDLEKSGPWLLDCLNKAVTDWR